MGSRMAGGGEVAQRFPPEPRNLCPELGRMSREGAPRGDSPRPRHVRTSPV